MSCSSKRGISMMPETLVGLILLTAFLLVILGLIFMVQGGFSNDAAKKYSCWFSSSIKSNSVIGGLLPSTCAPRIVSDPLDMKGVSLLLRDSWWQYGEGTSDFGVVFTQGFEAAKFRVVQDISVKDLMEFMLTHKKGRASSLESSDYNYLQRGSKGSTVCFDSEFEKEGYNFKANQDYYIYYLDTSLVSVNTDKMVVTVGPKTADFWSRDNPFFCYNTLTAVLSSGKVLNQENFLGGEKK